MIQLPLPTKGLACMSPCVLGHKSGRNSLTNERHWEEFSQRQFSHDKKSARRLHQEKTPLHPFSCLFTQKAAKIVWQRLYAKIVLTFCIGLRTEVGGGGVGTRLRGGGLPI